MLEPLIQAIKDSVFTRGITVDGNEYTTQHVYLPPSEPETTPIAVSQLSSVVDFVESLDRNSFICVKSAQTVLVVGAEQGRHKSRPTYLRATPDLPLEIDERWLDIDEMIIALNTIFVPHGNVATLTHLIGTINSSTVITSVDDGLSQSVTIAKSSATSEKASIPNQISLAPFRTFHDIEQPDSNFLIRTKRSDKAEELPKVALFLADGGLWKTNAIARIKEYLTENLSEEALQNHIILA